MWALYFLLYLYKTIYMGSKKKYSELSKTAKYYRNNPEARKKKAQTDKKINSRADQKRKRRELEKRRQAAIKKGVDTSKSDYDHAVGRRVAVSANRGRAEKSRLKGSKRK